MEQNPFNILPDNTGKPPRHNTHHHSRSTLKTKKPHRQLSADICGSFVLTVKSASECKSRAVILQ